MPCFSDCGYSGSHGFSDGIGDQPFCLPGSDGWIRDVPAGGGNPGNSRICGWGFDSLCSAFAFVLFSYAGGGRY